MMAIALGVAWAGYTVGIWGYCLVRGYDVPFTGLFKATWPAGGGKAAAGSGTTVPPNAGTGTYLV